VLISVTVCTVLQATCCSAARRTHAYCLQMELLEEVQAGSRRYAHKQIKWARGIELFRWLDATRPPAEIVAEIQQHLQDEPYTGM
jgi:tRNA A37 N6-isopentenylltransferase MiaA